MRAFFAAMICCVLLDGCVPTTPPKTTRLPRAAGVFLEHGDVASCYGNENGQWRTATGERYDPSGLTAAHRTLPFGTRVTVTNLANGRSVNVRINDRGPFVRGRTFDLSLGACQSIGLLGAGVGPVSVTSQ